MHLIGLVIITLALFGSVAEAQDPAPLLPGDLLRITTSDQSELTGLLTSFDAGTLELRSGVSSLSILRAELTKLERGRPATRRQSAWTGATWGALILAIPGAVSLAIQHEQIGEDGTSVPAAAALGAFSGALFGGLIGAAIGASRPGTRWESIPLSRVVRSATSSPANLGLVLSVGF